jgi:hypothetical protein
MGFSSLASVVADGAARAALGRFDRANSLLCLR